MKTVKTTNYANAVKQAEAIGKGVSDKIPEQIKDADKSVYHVLLVRKQHNPAKKRYDVISSIQTFHKGQAFEKIAKNYARHNFDELIIVHDPTKLAKADAEATTLKAHESKSIDAQIEKEEREAMEKRIAERKAEAKKTLQANKEVEAEKEAKDAKPKEPTLEFQGLEVTEANVIEFAKDNKIDISKAKSAQGKLAIVKKWVDAQ